MICNFLAFEFEQVEDNVKNFATILGHREEQLIRQLKEVEGILVVGVSVNQHSHKLIGTHPYPLLNLLARHDPPNYCIQRG